MDKTEITIDEKTGMVTCRWEAADAVEIGHALQNEGYRRKQIVDPGFFGDGTIIVRLADEWLKR